jgi:hypothetical protein
MRRQQAAPHRVFDLLAADAHAQPDRRVGRVVELTVGTNKPLNTESLHVYMYRLGAKLADFGLQIETMVNVGYRLIVQNRAS